jgi:tetraacyldisaccharide 4'-kinase
MRAPAFWWDEPGVAAALLSPLAALYGGIAARRLTLPGTRAGVPVICVGNPTVGGAGKTPTAMMIARLLIAAGERPMFLTRGYGGRLAGPVMVEAGHSAIQVGDEALLLTRVAPTIVAHNRAAGARLARDKGASVIVMDDGFQNPALAKEFSILVIDGRRRIGNGRVIPAGPLRAPLSPQLARANAILVVGEAAGPLPLPGAAVPVFHGVLEPDDATVKSLSGGQVLAFAGIGDPEKFFATLSAAGIDAPVRRGFPDHHRYNRKEAAKLIADADRAGLMLLTTEKDLARMSGDVEAAALCARARALPVSLRMRKADEFRAAVLGGLTLGGLRPA